MTQFNISPRYFIEYDDRQSGWHTMEGATLFDAKLVADEVAETLDQFGRNGMDRRAGISGIRITYILDMPIDVTCEIAEAVLGLRPHLSGMDALEDYVLEGAA